MRKHSCTNISSLCDNIAFLSKCALFFEHEKPNLRYRSNLRHVLIYLRTSNLVADVFPINFHTQSTFI